MEPLATWIEEQLPRAAAGMLRSVSPVDLVKERPGFGQTITSRKGAIVASPVLAAYDPDPDYFFHWFRDSALVIDALRQLRHDGLDNGEGADHFGDFVRFSRSLCELDGRRLAGDASWRARTSADFQRYLRPDEELAAVHGDAVSAEARVNPDGSLDISRWSRPQHDGPPLRALAVLRWLEEDGLDPGTRAQAQALLREDLDFTLRHGLEPGYDIWEEEAGEHYYTLCVGAAALRAGAAWFDGMGEAARAAQCRAAAGDMGRRLDELWMPEEGHFRSRRLPGGRRSSKELDIALVLAPVHAGTFAGPHSVADPRLHGTLDRLEALFETHYAINHARPPGTGPAMGRYAGDVYYSGGAYFFSTLGAAEFCFRTALAGHGEDWYARGDAYLETTRRFIPAQGDMSEQFDQRTGAQTSARHLAWSYAAFITCAAARRAAGTRSHGAG